MISHIVPREEIFGSSQLQELTAEEIRIHDHMRRLRKYKNPVLLAVKSNFSC